MMKTTQAGMLASGALVLLVLLLGCTVEQVFIGQWYTVYTPPAGTCPRLAWRFVVNPQRSINGFLANEAQQRIANLSGVLNADDSFLITASELGGARTAKVRGQFTSQVSTISIDGGAAGSGCDGQTFKVRLGRYLSSQGGGGGGGGM